MAQNKKINWQAAVHTAYVSCFEYLFNSGGDVIFLANRINYEDKIALAFTGTALRLGDFPYRGVEVIAETNEWSLLKRQFDALVDAEGDQRFEKFLDDKVLRRFGELIANAAQHKTHTKGYSQQRRRPASPQRRTSSRR